MPKGPQGQKRPADAVGLAVMIGKIATGEIEEALGPNVSQSKGGKKGGPARAASMSAQQRSEIASLAAQARWKKT